MQLPDSRAAPPTTLEEGQAALSGAPVHGESASIRRSFWAKLCRVTSSIVAVDGAAARKARGAFFTPAALCRYVADWAVRTAGDHVLEPSCGEAAFLLAAGERLDTLALATGAPRGNLDGVELHESSAREAERLVRAAGHEVQVQVSDFFLVTPTGTYDAVVGNPPYVRYQDFSGAARSRSREAALRAGVPLTGLASSWAAFTVHAALFLKTGGRLGLVLPAELLTVNYAAEVRRFLMERFARVRLVLFTERCLPGRARGSRAAPGRRVRARPGGSLRAPPGENRGRPEHSRGRRPAVETPDGGRQMDAVADVNERAGGVHRRGGGRRLHDLARVG